MAHIFHIRGTYSSGRIIDQIISDPTGIPLTRISQLIIGMIIAVGINGNIEIKSNGAHYASD